MEISGQGLSGAVPGTNHYVENTETYAAKESVAAGGKSALLNSLEPGNYVYGQVQSSGEDGAVLVLENGQKLLAKLAEGVTLTPGENVTFQVEKKQDGMVYLKPVFAEAALEMTAGKALKGAGFMNTPKNLEIVKELLELNMPVDKNTIRSMLQKSVKNPEMPVKQLALLEKLGIPVTKENIEQLKQYQAKEHQIGKQMDTLIKELGEATDSLIMGGKTQEAAKLNQKVLNFLYEELTRQDAGAQGRPKGAEGDGKAAGERDGFIENAAGEENAPTKEAFPGGGKNLTGAVFPEEAGGGETGKALAGETLNVETSLGEVLSGEENSFVGETLNEKESSQMGELPGSGNGFEGALSGEGNGLAGEVLPGEGNGLAGALSGEGNALEGEAASGEAKSFAKEALQGGQGSVAPEVDIRPYAEGGLESAFKAYGAEIGETAEVSVKEQVFELKNLLERTKQPDALKELLGSEKFRETLEKGMKEAWQMKPSEFHGKESINRSYARMEEQTRLLGELLKENNLENAAGSKTAANVQQNLEFMQDLNQAFPYIQLPLQMAGESAHGDLYVFKDKKKQHEAGEPFTAFLHLNMEHLGDVDVYLSLNKQQVSTDITLEKEEVFDLFEAHMDELTSRLEKKGYQVSAKLQISEKAPDFIDDILAKQAGGNALNRYSFDVKA